MTDLPTRHATKNDAHEMLRLVRVMWSDFGYSNVPAGEWEENFHHIFNEKIETDRDYRVVVIENPQSSNELIAMGIGIIQQVTPAFWITNGKMGYLQWFSTETSWRGQGLATKILNELMQWFDENDVTRVQLHSSSPAESLYRKHGFEDTNFPNLWWAKPSTEVE